jgi:phytoene dehydrogenase-like protein
MIESFFRPFIGGITLDPTLSTDRAFFEFVMHMFSEGDAAFPAGGMDAIPKQLAAGLNPAWIRLGTGVASIIDEQTLLLSDGSRVEGERIVIATDMSGSTRLNPSLEERSWNGTTCMYFDAPKAPTETPVLMLNGERFGRINNVVVPSSIAPGYAPPGRHLVAVSLFNQTGDPDPTPESTIEELRDWFGPEVRVWTHLHTYHIPHSLPSQEVGSRSLHAVSARLEDNGRIVCGDHLTTSSINGAMASGRVAAELLLAATIDS